MAKHKNGKKLDYFEAFEKQAELGIAEAKLLVEVIENYKGPDSLDDYIERAHEIEHAGDKLVHSVFDAVTVDFVTPIDREDIISLTQKLDDVLDYMEMDPIYRKYHHDKMTFSMFYAFSENYILPFSHDEVVHGKKSMLDKMPGDIWQKFASLRALFGYMFAHPGKKLMFMGAEFGQFIEWKELEQLDWFLLLYEKHPEMKKYTAALNAFYTSHPALYEIDNSWAGFTWCNADDKDNSTLSFVRWSKKGKDIIAICNFTPNYWEKYRIGVPSAGKVREVFNSDSLEFGGSGKGNGDKVIETEELPMHGHPYSMELTLPPLSVAFLTCQRDRSEQRKKQNKPDIRDETQDVR